VALGQKPVKKVKETYGDEHIGHIEDVPMIVVIAKVDEVDDFAVKDAVYKVP
jgi:hypothetical protein